MSQANEHPQTAAPHLASSALSSPLSLGVPVSPTAHSPPLNCLKASIMERISGSRVRERTAEPTGPGFNLPFATDIVNPKTEGLSHRLTARGTQRNARKCPSQSACSVRGHSTQTGLSPPPGGESSHLKDDLPRELQGRDAPTPTPHQPERGRAGTALHPGLYTVSGPVVENPGIRRVCFVFKDADGHSERQGWSVRPGRRPVTPRLSTLGGAGAVGRPLPTAGLSR